MALAPLFGKGVAVIVCAMVLFVGSVYLLLAAVFGLRMGYLVLAVSFFGWMVILSALWVFGAPGTLRNLGPRGTEPHWQVFAAGTAALDSRFEQSESYPEGPWHPPDAVSRSSVDSVRTAIQNYLAHQATQELEEQGEEIEIEFTQFGVQDVEFATAGDGTHLAAGRGYFIPGGPAVTVFAYHDTGNVPVYSYSFLAASIVGFAIHIPFLDRAERKRKAVLTGGAAPPWYGPA